MDDGDQYFEMNNFNVNFFHNATCQILMDGWQLMTLTWHHGCSYNVIAL